MQLSRRQLLSSWIASLALLWRPASPWPRPPALPGGAGQSSLELPPRTDASEGCCVDARHDSWELRGPGQGLV